MTTDTLDQVFSTYKILKDSMKVTRRSIIKSTYALHNKTFFLGKQKEEVNKRISDVEEELDDIMILSLFASFERELRVSIQSIIDLNINKNNPIIIKFIDLTSESIERWTMNDIVNAFDGIVTKDIRSKVKQIYEYRNCVAHGKNPNRVASIKTDPKTVYMSLFSFIKQASTVF